MSVAKAKAVTETPTEEKTDDVQAAESMMSDIINMVATSYKNVDKRQLSATLYGKLVSSDPNIKKQFDGKNMRLLASSFIGIMQIILDELSTMNVAACDQKMRALGGRHVAYGIGVNMFATYQACLLSSLQEILGDQFTEQLKYAWTVTWSTFVTTPISIGWESAAKMDRAKNLATVQESYNEVKDNAEFVDTLYKRLFEYDPKIKDLFKSSDMQAQKQKFVGFIGKGLAMALSGDPEGQFRKMAAMHKQKNVSPTHFVFFEEAILFGLRAVLKEKFTGELADAWTLVVHNEFVDKMINAPFKDIEDMLVEADTDGDGIVTLEEWKGALKEYGTADALEAAYKVCDTDNSGSVEAIEFVRMLSRQQVSYPQADIKKHMEIFVTAASQGIATT